MILYLAVDIGETFVDFHVAFVFSESGSSFRFHLPVFIRCTDSDLGQLPHTNVRVNDRLLKNFCRLREDRERLLE